MSYLIENATITNFKLESSDTNNILQFNATSANIAGAYPPGVIVVNGLAYAEVTSPYTGRTWLDRNLGATQVATSLSDSAAYGWHYQWGRLSDGHQIPGSTTVYNTQQSDYSNLGSTFYSNANGDWLNPSNENLWNTLNNEDWPTGYRVATESEWNSEVSGISSEFGSNTLSAMYNSFFKLTAAGKRPYGTVDSQGTYGSYWTSTGNGTIAACLVSYLDTGNMSGDVKGTGLSVRLIKSI